MAVIIEILGWGGKSRRHIRVESDSVRIGRGYDNDIVLADPHISPAHLRLEATDGGWLIEDQQSLNGLQVINRVGDTEGVFGSGSEIKIGRTRLRIVSTDQQVEPTRLLHRLERETSKLNRLSVWLPLFVVVFAIELGAIYANTAVEWEWKNAIPMLLGAQLLILVVALFWALIGRIVRHESHLLGQYSLVLLATLLFSCWDWLLSALDYNFNTGFFGEYMQQLSALAIAFVLLSANLALATNLSVRARWAGCSCFVLLLAIIGLVGEMNRWGEFSPFPEYSSKLEPPTLLVRGGQTTAEFLSDIDHLFTAAENNKKQ